MANTRSAAKRHRQSLRRNARNKGRLSRVRSSLKAVHAALERGDKNAAQEALRAAEPELARGVRGGVIHRRAMSRRVSRLSKRIKSL
jgi:small subunit ribosomal protein S20